MFMSPTPPKQHRAVTPPVVANADTIEWEEMPSLANRLVNHARDANDSRFQGATTAFDTMWGETTPAGLESAPVSQPFVERLDGLATREVTEPDVFQHFFGPNAES